jgi:tRNA G46 methylase TrmB
MKRYSGLWIVLGVAGGLLFGWTVLMKIVSRLAARLGRSAPCPFALAWLVDNPLRQRYMRPVLDWIGIQPGETVLELGPGPGVFTVEAARRVGHTGRVVAVDIQPEMIYRVGQRVRAAGLTNVTVRVADAQELPTL